MTVGHLRQLARLGGTVPFGELAFCKTMCEVCHKGDDEENIIPILVEGVKSNHPKVQFECAWILSNIATGTEDQVFV